MLRVRSIGVKYAREFLQSTSFGKGWSNVAVRTFADISGQRQVGTQAPHVATDLGGDLQRDSYGALANGTVAPFLDEQDQLHKDDEGGDHRDDVSFDALTRRFGTMSHAIAPVTFPSV